MTYKAKGGALPQSTRNRFLFYSRLKMCNYCLRSLCPGGAILPYCLPGLGTTPERSALEGPRGHLLVPARTGQLANFACKSTRASLFANMTSSLTTLPLSAWDMTPRGVDLPGNI
ncbi:uncharacterized protein LOC143649548 [Tamandua tetradactyla]|uniref:uncharacterized protein LOC143649548 n=1 Tax=Tamandua tetradactyla TaxID=48850 RepID=UPI0040538B0E